MQRSARQRAASWGGGAGAKLRACEAFGGEGLFGRPGFEE